MVSVTLLNSGDGHPPTVELVEPASRRSPVNEFLASGGVLHHIYIEVTDL